MVRDLEATAEGGPVPGGGVLRKVLFLVPQLLGVQEILPESLTERDGQVANAARPFTVVAEMVIHPDPFLVLGFKLLAEVGEEIHLRREFVQERVLSPDDRQLALGADSLGLMKLLFVRLFLDRELGILDEIDAEVLVPDVLLRHRILERWIEIQIQRYLPAIQKTLPECYFSCFHWSLILLNSLSSSDFLYQTK